MSENALQTVASTVQLCLLTTVGYSALCKRLVRSDCYCSTLQTVASTVQLCLLTTVGYSASCKHLFRATATVLHYILVLFGFAHMFSDLPAICECWSVLGATANIYPLGNLLEQFSMNLCCRILRYYGEVSSVSRERTEYNAEQKIIAH